jgi:hypothetical protein
MARSLNKKFFGLASGAGSQIVATVKFKDGAVAEGYIVKQVGARRFLFEKTSVGAYLPSSTTATKAKLVGAAPANIGEAAVIVSPFGGGTEYAKKITAKKVSTFSGNVYVWSTMLADAVGEADIIPGTDMTPVTATAHAVLATTGVVTSLVAPPTTAGTLYAALETLTLTGGVTLTVDTVDVGGEILTFTLTGGGTGRAVGEVLAVTGGSVAGTNATFTVSAITAGIASYVVDTGGAGYDVAPTVTVASGNAVPGAATIVNGSVTVIALGTAGSGYATAPAVIITP